MRWSYTMLVTLFRMMTNPTPEMRALEGIEYGELMVRYRQAAEWLTKRIYNTLKNGEARPPVVPADLSHQISPEWALLLREYGDGTQPTKT